MQTNYTAKSVYLQF